MPNVPTIVCAVDFSDHSKVALRWACAWARYFGVRLTVLTVAEPLLVNTAAAAYDMDLVREEVLPELLEFVAKTSGGAKLSMPSPESVVLVGEPAAEIAALAQRERAQLIVMATHGLSGYRKMLAGSTTEQVLRQATVPVMIAPPPEQGLPDPDSLMTGFGHVLVPSTSRRSPDGTCEPERISRTHSASPCWSFTSWLRSRASNACGRTSTSIIALSSS